MERLKRWLNKTGKFRFDGRKIGPGEEFNAYPSQVPACFRDTIDLLDDDVKPDTMLEQAEETDNVPVSPELEDKAEEAEEEEEVEQRFVVQRRSAGWYDILDQETGELANAKAIRKEEAEELAEELNDANG